MKRRAFITLLGGAAVWPLAARAQQPGKFARIGFLGAASASGYASQVEGFRLGLRDLGYIEGTNIVMDYRRPEGKYERLSELAADLIRANAHVIVTHEPANIPIERATKFEFVLNLKTAKALGIDIPSTVLARADEVIEWGNRRVVAQLATRHTQGNLAEPRARAERPRLHSERFRSPHKDIPAPLWQTERTGARRCRPSGGVS
jgi:hypothetical protein